jgi:hypothetical protein
MDKKNKIQSDYQNNNIKIDSSLIKTHIIFINEIKINGLSSDFSLLSLKTYINNKYSLQEYEYEVFIGENNINNYPDTTLILFLLNKYKENSITIKTFKNALDAQNQLNDYEQFLDQQISLKDEDIKSISLEVTKLMEDLNSI